MKVRQFLKSASGLFCVFLLCPTLLSGQIERFMPRQGGSTELWRITNDPSIRHWPNYHNTDAWSPDGRYVCYEKYEPYDINPERRIYIYDLHNNKEIDLGKGKQPRWANNHNWLIYIQDVSEGDGTEGLGNRLMWLDVDSNKLTQLAYGTANIGETDFEDRWIYGYSTDRIGFRVPIRPDSRVEILENNFGSQWIPNPGHPVIFYRESDNKDLPFIATRSFCDLEGKNITIGSPQIQRCHQSWSGDGEYLMHGNTLMKGRKWNEPFPSNLNIISAIQCGDICACGKSGRWVCGSGNHGGLQLADLRSGYGWNYLKAALSYIHDSEKFSYNFGSALNDNDSKGSADGTKIIFASNYDLKDGPVTEITEDMEAMVDRINVNSTDGFPASGGLSIGNEVVGYARKTETSFEGLSRNLYNTTGQNLDFEAPFEEILKEFTERQSDEEFILKYTLPAFDKIKGIVEKRPSAIRKGTIITSFECRLIPGEVRKSMNLPSRFASADFPDDKNSILLWQRRTDVYIAVVRLPDQPHFNTTGDILELVPGENHWETYGYNIYKSGNKISKNPVRPGETFILPAPGTYTASAVEWSGLESKKSFPIEIGNSIKLTIRRDKPADFSWTSERWLVDSKEVSKEEADNSADAVKEIIHRVEGVIHTEWYNWGHILKRHDLNAEGKAIRRLYYTNGKLVKREYYVNGEYLLSTELFDIEGYITESMQYQMRDGELKEIQHYWYTEGYPVKFTGSGGRHAGNAGPGIYEKAGDKWVKTQSF